MKRTKLSKKAQDRHDLIFKNFMNLIGGGMIGDSNYIGTCLNRLIQNQPLKKFYINNNDRTAQFVGHFKLKELDIDDLY